jgi:hypothetical protein
LFITYEQSCQFKFYKYVPTLCIEFCASIGSKYSPNSFRPIADDLSTVDSGVVSMEGIVSPPQAMKPKRGPGVSIDSGDRAERLRNAMTLALSGTTVRQAAAQYEIPRTTLCAYMKRHGVTAKRTFVNKRKILKGHGHGHVGVKVSAKTPVGEREDGFPFLGGFGNLVEGIQTDLAPEQGDYEEEEDH